MAIRQYVGARYVPRFSEVNDGNWSSIYAYEPLIIVKNGNDYYTSKKFVPTGVAITNTEYWALTGNYNGAISNLQSQINNLDSDLDELLENVKIGFVTPEMFGAVGDGQTNDTEAFANMFQYAKENNGQICIDDKSYNLARVFVTDKSNILADKGIYTNKSILYSDPDKIGSSNYNIEGFANKILTKEPYSTYIADDTIFYTLQSAGYSKARNVVLLSLAGYTRSTGVQDQPGMVLEVSPDLNTIYRSLKLDIGHANGTTYCSKDGCWYIATGSSQLGIVVINASTLTAENSKLVGDIKSFWTVVYDDEHDIFYLQSGYTQVAGSAKLHIYDYALSTILHEVAISQVYNPSKTAFMTSQDATLVNGQYLFLYFDSSFISLTSYNYETGEINNQIFFSNITGIEPEGVYVKDNYIYILSKNDTNLIAQRVLLNTCGSSPLAGMSVYLGAETDASRQISSGDDLNDYLAYGHYDCGSGAVAATLLNSPEKVFGFDLFVLHSGYEKITQILIDNAGTMFVRTGTYYTGVWGDWKSDQQPINTRVGGAVIATGFITNGAKTVQLIVPYSKSLDYITTISVVGGTVTLRGIGGYILNEKPVAQLNISAERYYNCGIMVTIVDNDQSPAFVNPTNNTPIAFQGYLTFDFT